MYPIPSIFASLLLLASCTTAPPARAQRNENQDGVQPSSSLIGSYTLTSGSEPHDIELAVAVSCSSGAYSLELQAWHQDAHGAAPDGNGVGYIDSTGVLRFAYEDNFFNRGSGSFRRTPQGYQLSIDIRQVSDSRCMVFYGDFTLQRTKPK